VSARILTEAAIVFLNPLPSFERTPPKQCWMAGAKLLAEWMAAAKTLLIATPEYV
jgi:hypothetical protein